MLDAWSNAKQITLNSYRFAPLLYVFSKLSSLDCLIHVSFIAIICDWKKTAQNQPRHNVHSNQDASSWLPFDTGGRIGPLRLVLAALLALDAHRRPAASDLLENPVFRRQARSGFASGYRSGHRNGSFFWGGNQT